MGLASAGDAELVALCRDGDESALGEFVERYSRYVYAIARRDLALSESDAEDVFQEVFARLYEGLGDLRDDGAVRPFVTGDTSPGAGPSPRDREGRAARRSAGASPGL